MSFSSRYLHLYNTKFSTSLMHLLLLILTPEDVLQSEIIEPQAFEWLEMDDKSRPNLKIMIHNESFTIPLQEAPFCLQEKTKKCNCFIRKRDEDVSHPYVASFINCGGKIRGHFIDLDYYYEIFPKDGGKSGEHRVKSVLTHSQENYTEIFGDLSKGQEDHKYNESFKYLKPLPEYGELFANETGYIYIKFVVSELIFGSIPDTEIDTYLQNYVNSINQFMVQLNFLVIYQGWTPSLGPETDPTAESIAAFLGERFLIYDKENILNAVVLFGPGEMKDFSKT